MRSLAGLVLLALAVPASAQADWGAPISLSPAARDTYTLGVAADSRDRPAVLLATRMTRGGWSVGLRTGDMRGRLGARVQITTSRNGVEGAGLFAGRNGDLVAGWLQIINGTRRPVVATGPGLVNRQVLAPGPRSTQVLRMAANRRGDAVAAFWRYSGQVYSIYAAYRPAGARFGAPQLIATGRVSNPAVSIDEDGNAVVAWTEPTAARVAERAAGSDAFAAPVAVPSPPRPNSEAAVAIEGGHVAVSWIVGTISAPRTVLVAERPTATAAFAAPVSVNGSGARIPHWINPSISLVDGQLLVAWVQGVPHTVTHDRAALAIRSGASPWRAPVLRGVAAPGHVYRVGLLARAAGRPPILAMTTSRAFHLRLLTASVRSDATLGPSRSLATGGDAGFAPWLAQGARDAWLATERALGSRHQALLFRSG
jgi:hypothetical protein